MGRLATFGIIGGKRAPVDELVSRGELDRFAQKVFEQHRVLEIAEKVRDGEPLNIRDFTRLLRRASIPILLKLVEVRGRRPFYAPTPAVLLPFSHWAEQYGVAESIDRSRWFLEQVETDELRVVLDAVHTLHMKDTFLEAMGKILDVRPGLTLVGPSAEELVHRVTVEEGKRDFTHVRAVRFVQLLSELRESGVTGLRPASTTNLMKFVNLAGFQPLLTTPVDGYGYAEHLAETLHEINRQSGEQQIIRAWAPCIKRSLASSVSQSARDMVLLRALAVGAIGLMNVPCIRASSRFFSLDALKVATLFGANDAGVGAANNETASQLLLLPFKTLVSAFPSPDGLSLLRPRVLNGDSGC
jgi:hypothetical protein